MQITAISCRYPAKKVQATCDPYQLPQIKAVESGQPAQNLPFSFSWFCSCVPSLNPLRGKSLHLGRKLKGLCLKISKFKATKPPHPPHEERRSGWRSSL